MTPNELLIKGEWMFSRTGKTTVQEENIFLSHDNYEGKVCAVIQHKDENDADFNKAD